MAASVASRRIVLACAGLTRTLAVTGARVRVGDRELHVVLHPCDVDGWRAVEVDGVRRQRLLLDDGERVHLVREAAVHVFAEPSPFLQPDVAAAARIARAPVAGVVAQVAVEVGQRVSAGQPLVCVEAMKMEMWLNAAADGVVAALRVAVHDTVASGAVLVELELDAKETT
jgi:biotin carboxyl carrier protein